jgi:hypothetical protein
LPTTNPLTTRCYLWSHPAGTQISLQNALTRNTECRILAYAPLGGASVAAGQQGPVSTSHLALRAVPEDGGSGEQGAGGQHRAITGGRRRRGIVQALLGPGPRPTRGWEDAAEALRPRRGRTPTRTCGSAVVTGVRSVGQGRCRPVR